MSNFVYLLILSFKDYSTHNFDSRLEVVLAVEAFGQTKQVVLDTEVATTA